MAIPGKRFNLNLDSEDWSFDVHDDDRRDVAAVPSVINDIQEHHSDSIPPAPTLKTTKTGFPERRQRKFNSSFKKQQQQVNSEIQPSQNRQAPEPSDAAIVNHIARKHGYNIDQAREQQTIHSENEDRLAHMTTEDIEQARSELMAQFDPEILRKFMQRSRIDDTTEDEIQIMDAHQTRGVQLLSTDDQRQKAADLMPTVEEEGVHHSNLDVGESEDDDESHFPVKLDTSSLPNIHFPVPPRRPEDFVPLDPNSDTFLTDLREHYFPDLPHDPSTLSWLQPPDSQEDASYDPSNSQFRPGDLRFDFAGKLLTPHQAAEIPVEKGLHHHGDAPGTAGYTIPELGLLARSTLPGQRSIAYQVLGRILFRLGRGEFGPRGGELQEALWQCIERDRVVETMMTEANRDGAGVHKSAQAYATEALWLWRRGGGGDRGVLKEGERRAT